MEIRYLVCCLYLACSALLSACGGGQPVSERTESTAGCPYRLDQPDTIVTLPAALREISGLSLSSDGSQLLAVNDEDGLIFFLSAETGKVEHTLDFGKNGDYEGIEVVGNDIYVAKSNGNLYRVPAAGKTETISTPLKADNDVEGLGYDATRNSLLIACKGKAGKEGDAFHHKRAVYAYDLTTQEFQEAPVWIIDRLEIARRKGVVPGFMGKWHEFFSTDFAADSFSPSGLAFSPRDSAFYMIASVGKTLAMLDPDGQILRVWRLDPALFRQPEGICFDREGRLFISTEGGDGPGQIFRYRRIIN